MADEAPRAGKMTDEELLALIAQYERASLGSQVAAGATISTTVFPSNQALTTLELDRYNALNAYLARPLGNEIENRSQVVLPELRDTIEWIMPQLMRMFVSAKTVCRFDPENERDQEQAELETLVVNHIFMQENNGFFVLHDFFKDALLLRNGYSEVYTEEKTEVAEERYSGLSEPELAILLGDNADEEIEVLGQRETQQDIILPANMRQPNMPPVAKVSVFDIHLKRTQTKRRTCVTCLPPEEMRISARAREGMESVGFAMHQATKTRSDLIQDGFDKAWVNDLAAGRPNWLEMDALARNQVVDQLSLDNPSDFAMQEVEVRKVIMRVDYDGDGIAELRRILIGGDKIGENEVIEETPFASCEPMRMPHRHTGMSYYDLMMDLQIIKTTLWRAGLDNLTVANNLRVAVDWRNCNIDDLLTSRPHGPIRGNGPPSQWIQPIQMPSNIVEQVLPTLQYMDELRTNRTGIGRTTAGLDADELQDVTKGAMLAQMSTAALKVELVARMLAEGVKDIFRKIHSEFIRNQDKPLQFELSGKWVTIDPTQWRRRTKVSVNVGLGSGNREEMRTNLALLAQAQAQVGAMGLIGPKQAYETFKLVCEALGFNSPERFAMDPASPEFEQHQQIMQQMAKNQPPAPQVQAAQIHAQTEQTKQQAESQRKIIDLQGQLSLARAKEAAADARADRQIAHEVVQNHGDRVADQGQQESDKQMTIMKILGNIVASQLKQDPEVNAGKVLAEDTKAAQQELQGRVQSLQDEVAQHRADKARERTATLPDGRQIKISAEENGMRTATLSDGRQVKIQ